MLEPPSKLTDAAREAAASCPTRAIEVIEMSNRPGRVVVVGASAAGLTTAEALRRNGYDGQVTLIGAEPYLPYDRPPLSKQVLAGTWKPERIALTDDVRCQRADLDLRLGTTATGVDVRARTVTLANGERLRYDKLVIATGVKPRHLPGVRSLGGVHVLRTVDDALALRADLLRARQVAVVGAGFLGCEVAATARSLGLDVTLIDPLPAPMVRQLGERLGRLMYELHSDHGVRFRTGLGVSELLGDESVTGIRLTDGTVIGADVVLVAVGSSPATQWLAGSGVPVGDGVLCDSTCQAAPNVYAVGDVARWHNPRFGGRMRVEHRMNATEQGLAVAANLLGPATAFQPVPYFWTDQFDARIQAYGAFPSESQVVIARGDPVQRRFVAHYLHDGRVTGVVGWNMPRELRDERSLVGTPACRSGTAWRD